MEYISYVDSLLGRIVLRSDGASISGLWFEGQRYFPYDNMETLPSGDHLPVINQGKRWLEDYFKGFVPSFLPPLRLSGTVFRQRVWKILLEIPYGQTFTYGQIAHQMGVASAQAVGGAVGHNPVSLMVPCHRVIGAGGALTGYAGGLERKRWLLEWETGRVRNEVEQEKKK